MPFTGGCLCGSITYKIERRHLNAMHCYCSMCRKAHGTAFSTHVVCRPDQLHWEAGRELLTAYESSPQAYREFCPRCGTHLLVHGQTGDSSLAIPAGTLDGDPPLTILGHMYTSEVVSWYKITDGLPQHVQWPPGLGRSARTAGDNSDPH